ncbi:MAG TPA: TolC family protein [Gemmatimonadaceae bacterium]|nr:TolC family protein [Gemmatimonadaceae bacterium]
MHIAIAAAMFAVQADTIHLSLNEALVLAQKQNTEFIRQQLSYENAVSRLSSAYGQRYLPAVNLDVTTPAYSSRLRRETAIDDNGQVVTVIGREQRRSLGAELNLSQPLPTGGVLRISGEVGSDKQPLLDPAERYQGATNVGISLQQEFFGVNRTVRDYRLAKEDFARSEAQLLDGERGIARFIMSSYFQLVRARKQAVIDSVTFLRDSLRNANTTAGGATVSEVDSLKFELEAARSAFNRTRSAQNLRRARAQLNEALALPSGTVVIPDSALRVERVVADVDTGLQYARGNRYDLRLAQLSVANRADGLRDARRTSPVRVILDGRLGFDGSGTAGAMQRALDDAFGTQGNSKYVELRVSIPLLDRRSEQNNVQRAINDLRIAESRLADEMRSLENEVRLAAQRVENAATQLTLAERQVEITRRTLALQLVRYESAQISSLEFLIDQGNTRSAELSLIDAQVEMLEAAEEWRRAIGARSQISSGIEPRSRFNERDNR